MRRETAKSQFKLAYLGNQTVSIISTATRLILISFEKFSSLIKEKARRLFFGFNFSKASVASGFNSPFMKDINRKAFGNEYEHLIKRIVSIDQVVV